MDLSSASARIFSLLPVLAMGVAAPGCGFLFDASKAKETATPQPHGDFQFLASAPTVSSLVSGAASTPSAKLYVRFERGELSSGALADVVAAINGRITADLKLSDLRKSDDLQLATSHYLRYAQVKSGVDVDGASVRIWLDQQNNQPILVEAFLADPRTDVLESYETPNTHFADVLAVVHRDFAAELKAGRVRSIQTTTVYKAAGGLASGFVRRVQVKTARGQTTYEFENSSDRVLAKRFRELPQADRLASTYSLPANVYPLWELPASDKKPDAVATPVRVDLPNILNRVPDIDFASYLTSRSRSFLTSKRKSGDLTPDELLAGFWNDTLIRFLFPDAWENRARFFSNTVGYDNPVRLYGKNVVVTINREAGKLFPNGNAPVLRNGPQFTASYTPVQQDGSDDNRITYAPLKWGIPIRNQDDLLNRSPLSGDGLPHPERSAELLQAGFDEAQVYYGTDVFLSVFQQLGFTDPDMSTRPFVAVLFDPDVEGADNAFYDSNTINFATYSASAGNMARDNSTIWHELGHGLQDRVMGPHVDSSEGYGLWEGMADFLAQTVIANQFGLDPFQGRETLRILNNTHFYLTNESHDEGEAYGGAMNTMLEAMITKYGKREGLLRMTDLTLEAMRLTRDHPALTAEVWFEQMKYADSLPRTTGLFERGPGELQSIIDAALSSRNYKKGSKPGRFVVQYKGDELNDRDAGSRQSPISLDASGPQTQSFDLTVTLIDGDEFQFRYPATVRVAFSGGALQGALKWKDESKGPVDIVIPGPGMAVPVHLEVDATTCEFVNRSNGGCRDYAYLQVFNGTPAQGAQPLGKKRFYLSR